MLYTRYPFYMIATLLLALMLHSCRSVSLKSTEEELFSESEDQWLTGPCMQLASNEQEKKIYPLNLLPPEATFSGCRIKPGLVAERSSWSVSYVRAESLKAIEAFCMHRAGNTRETGLSIEVMKFVPSRGVGGRLVCTNNDTQNHFHNSKHRYAALVLEGKTKRNGLFCCLKSVLDIALEIGYVLEPSLNIDFSDSTTSPMPSLTCEPSK